MREILFRGKQLNGTEWFEGDLSHFVHSDGRFYVFPADGYNSPDWYEVDPDTVGLYTGLTDKRGAKIFEGDIVRHKDRTLHEVVFERRNGNAYFGWTINELETWLFDRYFLCQLEVIGNIYDNPELLERST